MEKLDVGVVVFSRAISGGANIIFNYCLYAPTDVRVTIIYVDREEERELKPWHAAFDASHIEWLPLRKAAAKKFDVLVFTYYETVYLSDKLQADSCIYFVQSIESRFTPNSPIDAMRAEITYAPNFGFITVASWISKYLQEVHGHTSVFVRNGIDKTLFRESGPCLAERSDRLRVVVEGSLGARFKRVPETLELLKGIPNIETWLLTPTATNDDALADRVISGVPISEVASILRSCDVLLKLSTVEGMFGPPLEMFHCGGTAITSNVTGHEEYIRHGENALVVESRTIGRARDYVEMLASEASFLRKLKEGAKRTAEAWPTVEQSAIEFWRAFGIARSQARVGTAGLAAYLRPHRLLVRASLSRPSMAVRHEAGLSIKAALDAVITDINSGAADTRQAFNTLRVAMGDLGITPDDALALQAFVRRNYDEGSPLYQLAWHVAEYMYVYAMNALNADGKPDVAAFWFGIVVDLASEFAKMSDVSPPRSFLLPMGVYHLALANFLVGHLDGASHALTSLWRMAVEPAFATRFVEVEKTLHMSLGLAVEIAKRPEMQDRMFLSALDAVIALQEAHYEPGIESAIARIFNAVAEILWMSSEVKHGDSTGTHVADLIFGLEGASRNANIWAHFPRSFVDECLRKLKGVPKDVRKRLIVLLRQSH